MTTIFLEPIRAAAVGFFVLAVLCFIPIFIVHYRRFGYARPTKAIVLYAFLFYALCAMALVALPLPELTPDFCAVRADLDYAQLTPFQFLQDIARDNHLSVQAFNLITILKSRSFLQVFFNFLLLLPLGLFLNYFFRVSFWIAGLIALATTLTFEVSQLTGLFGGISLSLSSL